MIYFQNELHHNSTVIKCNEFVQDFIDAKLTQNCDATDYWWGSLYLINSPPFFLQFDIWKIWRWKCQRGSDVTNMATSLCQDNQLS